MEIPCRKVVQLHLHIYTRRGRRWETRERVPFTFCGSVKCLDRIETRPSSSKEHAEV